MTWSTKNARDVSDLLLKQFKGLLKAILSNLNLNCKNYVIERAKKSFDFSHILTREW